MFNPSISNDPNVNRITMMINCCKVLTNPQIHTHHIYYLQRLLASPTASIISKYYYYSISFFFLFLYLFISTPQLLLFFFSLILSPRRGSDPYQRVTSVPLSALLHGIVATRNSRGETLNPLHQKFRPISYSQCSPILLLDRTLT